MHQKITTICFITLLFFVTFTFTSPPAHSVDWSVDMRLTWKWEIDQSPSMTQTSDGKIWVVWCSRRTGNPQIFYKVYDKTQVHPWSPETQLTSNTYEDVQPSITQAQNGTIIVVWASNRTGKSDIYYKTYNGSAWSPDQPLITDPESDLSPAIMQAANGTIWLVWESDRFLGDTEIYYATSSNNWSEERLTSNVDRGDKDPSIMQAADGKVWVAWSREVDKGVPYDCDIYYKTYNVSGWTTQKNMTVDPSPDMRPSITQAQDGKIWVVWDSARDDQTDIYYKFQTGGSWSADTRLTFTDYSNDFDPSIIQDTDDTIIVSWWSTRLESIDLYYKTNTQSPADDVSIFSVEPQQVAVRGKNASIEVVAQNKGTDPQTFDVTCYADSIPVETKSFSVDPGQLKVSYFQWNTSEALGTYTIRAEAATVPGETHTADNTYDDGTITVVKHDVSVKSVTPSETVAQQGYGLEIYVVVKNQGNFTESVTVTVYRNPDSTSIGTQTVTGLAPSAETTLTFEWTPLVAYGSYNITASALPVDDEIDLSDNSKTAPEEVMVTIPGDVNGEHNVDTSDLLLISNYWYSEGYDTNIDVQNDGIIDIFDIFIVSIHWGQSW